MPVLKRSTWLLAGAVVGVLAAPMAAADSMRCGRWIVTPDLPPAEILHKCGEPTAREVTTEDVYGPSNSGVGRIRVGTTTLERWIYDRGSQAFTMIVTIRDGRTTKIERAN